MRGITLAVLASFFGFGIGSTALAEDKTALMAALGDSITAATLADFSLPIQDENPKILYDNPYTLSWSTGREIPSHASLLKDYLAHGSGTRLGVLNIALPGATAADLKKQALTVAQTIQERHYSKLAYVTLLIGSNDACSSESPSGTPRAKIREGILDALEVLAAIPQKDRIPVLLVGIPKIPDLGRADIRQRKTVYGMKCETVRNRVLHFCNPLVTWSTPDEYQDKVDIVENINRLLRDLAPEATARFPKLDVVYTQRLYEFDIPAYLLAADCFHPNETGQREISSQLWSDQPWFHPRAERLDCAPPKLKVSAPTDATWGAELDYTIRIENPGTCDWSGLTLTDFLPRQTEYLGASPIARPVSGGTPPQVLHAEWPPVDLPAGSVRSFQLRLKSLSAPGRVITDTACIERGDLGRICDYADTDAR